MHNAVVSITVQLHSDSSSIYNKMLYNVEAEYFYQQPIPTVLFSIYIISLKENRKWLRLEQNDTDSKKKGYRVHRDTFCTKSTLPFSALVELLTKNNEKMDQVNEATNRVPYCTFVII